MAKSSRERTAPSTRTRRRIKGLARYETGAICVVCRENTLREVCVRRRACVYFWIGLKAQSRLNYVFNFIMIYLFDEIKMIFI